MVLLDILSPPPHVFEHLDQAYQGDHEQSTFKEENGLSEQGFSIQLSVLVDPPLHSFPPLRAFCVMFLIDCLNPVPHVTEQSDHPPYDDHIQSTGSVDVSASTPLACGTQKIKTILNLCKSEMFM